MMILGRVEPGYEYLPLCVQVIAAILLALPSLSAQSPLALKDLTVPAQSLPSGCKLKSAPRGQFLGANTNPWITTDRRSVGLLSMFVSLTAGERKASQQPIPNEPAAAARYLEAQSEGIEDAYIAVYTEPGAPEVGMYALRYATPRSEPGQKQNLSESRAIIRFGSIVVMLWVDGDGRRCFDAVKAHVLAVKARSDSHR